MPHTVIPAAEVESFLAFANELADAASPLALSYFRTPLDIISKLDESPVTIADRTIENEIREIIQARFPTHGIYGEEMGIKKGDEFTWVLDPLDGTKSFITGFPLFGTLISLTYLDKPFCGLIDVPATGERWQASPGQTLFGGKPAVSSGCTSLSEARFYTTSPDMFIGPESTPTRRCRGPRRCEDSAAIATSMGCWRRDIAILFWKQACNPTTTWLLFRSSRVLGDVSRTGRGRRCRSVRMAVSSRPRRHLFTKLP